MKQVGNNCSPPQVNYFSIVKRLNEGEPLENIAKAFNVNVPRMIRKLRNMGFFYSEGYGRWVYRE
ncbi:hypothetical protein [Bacillus paranthracis]|uniref:hypothetical protein n=1 Tax=Bacillus paranthracis TaxID=2026186 RepID=UPI0028138757|nr:hypothetical protein [Bacillus paranthracis]MDR0171414.1 hypothetical protein [Bacillus paranthracis]